MTLFKRSTTKGKTEILAEKNEDKTIVCSVCNRQINDETMTDGCGRTDCPFGHKETNNQD